MASVSNAGILAIRALQELRAQGSLSFLSAFARIPDKEAEGVRHPFVAWPIQRKIIQDMTGQDVYLKPAQTGATSIISCDFLFDAMYTPDTTVVIMAHKGSTTERLLRRVKVVYDSIPDAIKPAVDHDSATELRFPGHNSIIYIVTAREEVAGRGEPIHRLLLSESAFYPPNAFKNIVAPALQRVPRNGKVVYECYDEETEVLTRDGWKYFRDTGEDDEFFTKDPDTNKATYLRATKRQSYSYDSFMLHFQSKGIDLMVTPNHQVWVSKNAQTTYHKPKFYSASDVPILYHNMENSVLWEGKREDWFVLSESVVIPMDDWLEFLGYFLSEGWVSNGDVGIGQSKDSASLRDMRDSVYKIAGYLHTEPHEWVGKQNCVNLRIRDSLLYGYLSEYTKPKRFPSFVFDLVKEQMLMLITAFRKGDGDNWSFTRNSRLRFYTVDKSIADGLMEIGLKLGYSPSMQVRQICPSLWRPELIVNFGVKTYRRIVREPEIKLYKGNVYDVTLPDHHLLMVRRNGKVIWSGNSTPNAEDELFYPLVQDCLNGKSDFSLHVLYWWENPDNWLEAGSVRVMEEDRHVLHYTDEELLLVQLHDLKEEQIRWRRWKIRQVGPLFWQEHIEDINTCFLTFGEPFYDKYRLVELAKGCYPAPHSFMGAQVWFEPEPDASYVIGVDPGQGKVSDSVASVWRDMGTHARHEATLSGLIESPEMARRVKELGKHYNTALIVPEANSHGIGFTSQVTDYRRLYWRRDTISGRPTNSIGWLTSPRTKPFMMSELARNLENLETYDEVLVRQIGGFREVGVGKLPVTTGKDDHHDAACLAMIGMSGGLPKARGYVGKVGWPW